jgi:U3 small nucleolar RNA-associated protein 10
MPEAVLHSVMPIFTFMGSTILRQSDDYSAHVIDQTVSRVIPPLVGSLRKRSRDVVSGVSDLLLSFTAAFEHIPLHRRLKLFELLVNALGPQDCLFAVIVLIIDRHPTDSSIRSFIVELMNMYPAETNLKVCNLHINHSSQPLTINRQSSNVLISSVISLILGVAFRLYC